MNNALADAIFTPTANFNGTATVKVETDDSNGGTDSETTSVTVNAVDDNPVVDLDQDDDNTTGANYQASFTEGDAGVTIADSDASLENVDGPNLSSLTVTLTNRPDGAQESLSVKDLATLPLPGGISVSDPYDDADGQLVLSGSASIADYETALQRVVYANTSGESGCYGSGDYGGC